MPRVREQDFEQLVLAGRCVDSEPRYPAAPPHEQHPNAPGGHVCKRCAWYVAARWWRHRDGTVTHIHYGPCGDVIACRRHDRGWNWPGVPAAEVRSQPCS